MHRFQLTLKLFGMLLLGGLINACGERQGPGEITNLTLPPEVVIDKQQRQDTSREQLAVASDKQVLFGDLHVHTTFSPDAFITSMPLMGGEGVKPPADACDFARYCSVLDFWSINDHAEGISPQRWADTKQSIRDCNAAAGDPQNPDMVAFLGWEWSQVDPDPDKHYGHKNIVLRDTAEADVPLRPIAAPRAQLGSAPIGKAAQMLMAMKDFENRQFYFDINIFYQEMQDTPACELGVNTRDLPENCHETAANPRELFDKLDEWDFESIVIPHGNAWGMNTPAGNLWDKQLEDDDPQRQSLIEVYSGHGNSEEYRTFKHIDTDAEGNNFCPPSVDGFTPCCQRAGEIIRERCDSEGLGDAECSQREAEARQNYTDAGPSGHLTVPGAQVTDWLSCGLCTDCFNPAFKIRPGTTTQYGLSLGNFDDEGQPVIRDGKQERFRWGFIGSSDNHLSRGGSGYKEFARLAMTEANGVQDESLSAFAPIDRRDPVAKSEVVDKDDPSIGLNRKRNMERQASFFMTGGLAAVHSEGRSREAIWNALKRKEVYATSGDRILLWFDMLAQDDTVHPMGSEVPYRQTPRFRVKASGSFEQQAGCPDYTEVALGSERLESLCRGECYNPGDQRRPITRIEVVRIQPQISPDEKPEDLIRDPWKTIDCPADSTGCMVEFEDPEYQADQRETLYYARAIQTPTLAVNAGNLRCEYDENGQCIKVNPCYGDYRTDGDDDCLSPNEERAWSSPIYLIPQ